MKKLKVAILGAGTMGLYLAWKLSEKGNDVTVFERKKTIGKECCSGLFSERILEFIPQSEALIKKFFTNCLINFPHKSVNICFKKKVFLIEHAELDRLLAKIAEESGVKIILEKEMRELPEGFDRVIGCDGPNSFVRKSLSLPSPKIYLGVQTFITVSQDVSRETSPSKYKNVSRETLETWPVKSGFIWGFEKENCFEYGIMAPPSKAVDILKDFLAKEGLELTSLKSAPIPQGLILPKNEKITLCGDAAGMTKPWTGGGVIWGLTAADILLKKFPDFSAYRSSAIKFFGLQIAISKLAKFLVYFLGFNMPFLLPKKAKIDNDFLSLF
jgi:flavin-dependent dehydrogenase